MLRGAKVKCKPFFKDYKCQIYTTSVTNAGTSGKLKTVPFEMKIMIITLFIIYHCLLLPFTTALGR